MLESCIHAHGWLDWGVCAVLCSLECSLLSKQLLEVDLDVLLVLLELAHVDVQQWGDVAHNELDLLLAEVH